MKEIKSITERNMEILDKFFKDMQRIIYCKSEKKKKIRMLYASRYWAEYFMKINNNLLIEKLKT